MQFSFLFLFKGFFQYSTVLVVSHPNANLVNLLNFSSCHLDGKNKNSCNSLWTFFSVQQEDITIAFPSIIFSSYPRLAHIDHLRGPIRNTGISTSRYTRLGNQSHAFLLGYRNRILHVWIWELGRILLEMVSQFWPRVRLLLSDCCFDCGCSYSSRLFLFPITIGLSYLA